MKCQRLLSGKNKKNLSKCHLLKFLPSMQSSKAIIIWLMFSILYLRKTKVKIKFPYPIFYFDVFVEKNGYRNKSLIYNKCYIY